MQVVIRHLPDELRDVVAEIKEAGGYSSAEAVLREALKVSPLFAEYDIDWPEVKKGGARANAGPKPKTKSKRSK